MDIWAGIGDMLLILVGLFVVRLVVVSVWDAWEPARAKRRKQVETAAVPELDFSAKRLARDRLHTEWEQEFMASLGADRDEFVAQWGKDSERLKLARWLKEDQEEAELRGDVWVREWALEYRHWLVQNMATPMAEADLRKIREARERWRRRWSGVFEAPAPAPEFRTYAVRSADGSSRQHVEFVPPAPPRGASGVSMPGRYREDDLWAQAEQMLRRMNKTIEMEK